MTIRQNYLQKCWITKYRSQPQSLNHSIQPSSLFYFYGFCYAGLGQCHDLVEPAFISKAKLRAVLAWHLQPAELAGMRLLVQHLRTTPALVLYVSSVVCVFFLHSFSQCLLVLSFPAETSALGGIRASSGQSVFAFACVRSAKAHYSPDSTLRTREINTGGWLFFSTPLTTIGMPSVAGWLSQGPESVAVCIGANNVQNRKATLFKPSWLLSLFMGV